MAARRARLHIGCSGWNYRSWRGRFYPHDLPASQWLRHYAKIFDTVEVNNTFYRLPESSSFRAWQQQTPSGFVMAIKASRFLTHIKRLREPHEPLERLFSRASALGSRLGPVLYQLPPTLHLDLERLESFLKALPSRWRQGRVTGRAQHAVEFRHPSWYVGETFRLLEQHDVALCLHDKLGSAIDKPFIGPFVYIRFHGTSGRYSGSYPRTALRTWARSLSEQWQRGRDVYAYFNNDPDAIATNNARELREQILTMPKASRATRTNADFARLDRPVLSRRNRAE